MLRASGHELFFHEFEHRPEDNKAIKQYEIDFLIVRGKRLSPIEVKSSGTRVISPLIISRTNISLR